MASANNLYLQSLAGEYTGDLPAPKSVNGVLLAKMAGEYEGDLPEGNSVNANLLKRIIESGGGGVATGFIDVDEVKTVTVTLTSVVNTNSTKTIDHSLGFLPDVLIIKRKDDYVIGSANLKCLCSMRFQPYGLSQGGGFQWTWEEGAVCKYANSTQGIKSFTDTTFSLTGTYSANKVWDIGDYDLIGIKLKKNIYEALIE